MEATDAVRCPRCGDLRPGGFRPISSAGPAGAAPPHSGDRPPPGTITLPTFGSALKRARGAAATCECGKRRLDADGRELSDPAVGDR